MKVLEFQDVTLAAEALKGKTVDPVEHAERYFVVNADGGFSCFI